MQAVIAVALPVFAVIAAGFLAGRFRFATAEDSAALNRFVFRFAMPAALFGMMAGTKGLARSDLAIAASYGLAAFAVIAVAFILARKLFRLTAPEAGAHAFASSVGNAVFLGLPIALAIEGWARPFVVLMLVEGILIIGVGAALMTAPAEGGAAGARPVIGFFMRPLRTPIVAAALAGLAAASLGADLPGPLAAFFEILGRAAGPAALFSLGLFLAVHAMAPIEAVAPKIAAIALCKMALLPGLAFAAAFMFGVGERTSLGALALFTATPTAIGAYVMASQFGHYVREIVAAIAATTIVSLLTISAVLVLFAG